MAGVFFVESITVSELQKTYADADAISARKDGTLGHQKIKILIMPGHEPKEGGTEFRGVKERDIAVEIGQELARLLETNPRFQVIVARDTAAWNPIFEQYFKDQWDKIIPWRDSYKTEMLRLVGEGKVTILEGAIEHNNAPVDAARRLYGINKWVDENDVDIAIHLHVNDNPRSNTSVPGMYSGYTIFIPEKQYSNARATGAVANSIAARLSKYFPKGNLVLEDGVVEDQELIAIGRHNTVDAASMLIEYGYIYEPQYAVKEVREAVIKEYALETYLGVQDFFGAGSSVAAGADSFLLSHGWTDGGPDDVVALQFSLTNLGYYPPKGSTQHDCGYSSKLGPCTLAALAEFQKDKGITGEKGVVGKQTIRALYPKLVVK